MTTLDDCPDDIIQNIFSRLHRFQHLLFLSLACRRLRRLVVDDPGLEDSRKYVSPRLYTVQPGGLPSDALLPILKRSERRFYVQRATINFQDSQGLSPSVLSRTEELEFLDKAVKETGILKWKDGHSLVGALTDGSNGSQGARVAILLLMHCNLESLSIEVGGDDRWIRWALGKVLSFHLRPSPFAPHGFHALREVEFKESRPQTGYGLKCSTHGFSLESLVPFFMLPSIETISADYISQTHDFEWDREFGVSKVTMLDLYFCNIINQALEVLLSIPKALLHFRYMYGGPPSDYNPDEVRGIVKRTQSALDKDHVHVTTVWRGSTEEATT